MFRVLTAAFLLSALSLGPSVASAVPIEVDGTNYNLSIVSASSYNWSTVSDLTNLLESQVWYGNSTSAGSFRDSILINDIEELYNVYFVWDLTYQDQFDQFLNLRGSGADINGFGSLTGYTAFGNYLHGLADYKYAIVSEVTGGTSLPGPAPIGLLLSGLAAMLFRKWNSANRQTVWRH